MSVRTAGYGRLGPLSGLVALLAMYGADEEFGRELQSLHARRYSRPWHHELVYVRMATRTDAKGERIYPDGDEAAGLLDDLGSLVRRFGLHRIDADGAMEWIHEWALRRSAGGASVGPDRIILSLASSYAVPDSPGAIWRPDIDTKATALTRARERGWTRREAREALQQTQREWQEAGWTFPDVSPEAAKHLRWLYLAIRHDWTFAQVAEHWDAGRSDGVSLNGVGLDGMRKAVGRLAHWMDVKLPGPGPRRRRTGR